MYNLGNMFWKSPPKLLAMACICAGFALTGCSSDNNDENPLNPLTIDARVENGNDYNSQIDSVRAFVNDDDTQVVATAKYVNGGFLMTLLEILVILWK
jgi:hypothetical protein